jgi:hypothetical protein
LFRILTINDPKNIIHISANENKLEGVTEIVVEGNSFEDLTRIIAIFNESPQGVIERLREDTDDIMLELARVASLIKRMTGGFTVENMDNGRTAYMFITLPLVLRITE